MRSFRLSDPDKHEDLRAAVEGQMDSKAIDGLIELARSKARSQKNSNLLVGAIITCALAAVIFLAQSAYYEPVGLAVLGILLLLTLFESQMVDKRTKRAFSELLIEKGIRPATCLRCGYNLRGSTSDTCPECGEKTAPATDIDS